jgi:PD-(D/E)XK endonuclease
LSNVTTDQKGAIAEAAIILEAAKLGIGVLKPVTEGLRYDLIFDLPRGLRRVQCKWAVLRDGVVVVPLQSCRRSRDGYRRRPYTAEETDVVAAHCAALGRCFWLPIDEVGARPALSLRIAPARNNQRLKINWAADFDLGARLVSLGAVAQLGEH